MLAHTPCSLTNALVAAETTPKYLTLSKTSNVFVGLGHPSVRNRSAITSIAFMQTPCPRVAPTCRAAELSKTMRVARARDY